MCSDVDAGVSVRRGVRRMRLLADFGRGWYAKRAGDLWFMNINIFFNGIINKKFKLFSQVIVTSLSKYEGHLFTKKSYNSTQSS